MQDPRERVRLGKVLVQGMKGEGGFKRQCSDGIRKTQMLVDRGVKEKFRSHGWFWESLPRKVVIRLCW